MLVHKTIYFGVGSFLLVFRIRVLLSGSGSDFFLSQDLDLPKSENLLLILLLKPVWRIRNVLIRIRIRIRIRPNK